MILTLIVMKDLFVVKSQRCVWRIVPKRVLRTAIVVQENAVTPTTHVPKTIVEKWNLHGSSQL